MHNNIIISHITKKQAFACFYYEYTNAYFETNMNKSALFFHLGFAIFFVISFFVKFKC